MYDYDSGATHREKIVYVLRVDRATPSHSWTTDHAQIQPKILLLIAHAQTHFLNANAGASRRA